MSSDIACMCPGTRKEKMKHWRVTHRGLASFGYYSHTFSEVECTECLGFWRTKAAYVKELPDEKTRERMSVKGIVAKWLRKHGYGGLYNYVLGCGCRLDEEFMCCSEPGVDCEPAYEYSDPRRECGFVMKLEKPTNG